MNDMRTIYSTIDVLLLLSIIFYNCSLSFFFQSHDAHRNLAENINDLNNPFQYTLFFEPFSSFNRAAPMWPAVAIPLNYLPIK